VTAIATRSALPADFAWSQSAITTYLSCPRSFLLRFVERRPLDHVAAGFAGPLGTGTHAGIAAVLQAATAQTVISADEVRQLMLAAFQEACARAAARGEVLDDEATVAALDRLEGELLEQVLALERDRRVRSIRWTRVEERFAWTDRHGRKFQGTLDAAGEARDYVYDFAARGPNELVPLERGAHVVVDWKTGDVAVDHVARAVNVQLAFYTIGLVRQGAPRPRAFLARLGDVLPPKAPRDAAGEVIPKRLRDLNPAWINAAGLAEASHEERLASSKKPRAAGTKESIPKWIERENPAFTAATSKPRGPVFHECDINFELASRTITDVIRGAEAGLFPASGAATGQCLSCPFRKTCTASTTHGGTTA
jgi:hypothetical protein